MNLSLPQILLNEIHMKQRIVFNRTNPESLLATVLLVNALKQLQYNVETIPYGLTGYQQPIQSYKADKTFIIGAQLSRNELHNEAFFCDELIIVDHNMVDDPYSIGVLELKEQLGNKVKIFTSDFYNDEVVSHVEDVLSRSLLKLTRVALSQIKMKDITLSELMDPNSDNAEDIKAIYDSFEAFCNVKDVSAADILIVHENIDQIYQSAHTGTAIKLKGYKSISDKIASFNGKPILKENTSRIFKARNFIQNAMTGQLYGDQKSSMLVQTIQVSEEYLYDIVRLASYPNEVVALYQDFKHYRYWWIYSSDNKNAHILANLIPHVRRVTDGVFIQLISHLPKADK